MDQSPEARDLMIQQRILFKNLNNRLKNLTWMYDRYTHGLHSPQEPTLNDQHASAFSPYQQHTLSSPLYSITESVEEMDSCQRRSPAWSENRKGKMAKSECGPTFSEHILFDPMSEEEMTSRTAADRSKHYLQSLDELYSEGNERSFIRVQSRVKKKGFPLWNDQQKSESRKSSEVSTQRADDLLDASHEGAHLKEYLQALVTLEKEQKIRKDHLLNTVFALKKSGNKQFFHASGFQEWSDSLAGRRRPDSNEAASVRANPWDCESVRTNFSHSNSASKRETKGALQGKRRISSGKLAGGDNLETDASQKVYRDSKRGFPNGPPPQSTTDDVNTFNGETLDSSPPRKKDGFDLLRMLQAFFSCDSKKTLHEIFFSGDSVRDQASKEGEQGGDISPEEDRIAGQKTQEFSCQRNGKHMRAGCGDMRRQGSSNDNIEAYVGNFTDTEVSDVSDSDSATSVVSAIQLVSPQVPKRRVGRSGHQQMPKCPLQSEVDLPKEKKTQTNMLKGAEFLVQAICDNIQHLVPEYLHLKFPADEYGTRHNSPENEEINARKHSVSQERKRKLGVQKTVSELTWDGTTRTKHKPLNKNLFRRLRPRCLVGEDAYTKTWMDHRYSNLCKVYQQEMPNIYQKENRKLLTSILMKSRSQSRSNLTPKKSSLKQNPSTPSFHTDWKQELMKLTQDVYDNPQSPDLFDPPDLSAPEPLTKPSFDQTNPTREFHWLAYSARPEDSDSNSDESQLHDQKDVDATTVSEETSAHTSPCLACRVGLEGSSDKAGSIDFLNHLTQKNSPEQFALQQPTWSSFSQPASPKKRYASASNIFTQQPKHSTERLWGVCSDTGHRAFSKQPPRDQTSNIMKESRDLLLAAISVSVKDLLKNRLPSSKNFTPSDIQAAAGYVTGNTALLASLLKLVADSLALRQAKITQQLQL